jgi:hypothetical protein
MNMTIDSLPLKRTWLADIVDEFLRAPGGIDHVDAIVNRIMRSGRDLGKAPKETVTRRINDYCRDAKDSDRKVQHPIFAHVRPGTYRLLTYPDYPNLIEIQEVQFSDSAFRYAWQKFSAEMKSSQSAAWAALSKRERLIAFLEHAVRENAPRHYLFDEFCRIGAMASGLLPLRSQFATSV